jgi:uncharacterized glyoxalase superfamily protein PhnB
MAVNLRNLTVVRHTINYEPMIQFYEDALGMTAIERWNRPDSRGSVFAPPGSVSNASIEVLELGDVCVPGVAPTNVELSLFVNDVGAVHDQLRARGVPITRELEDAPWGHRSFGIEDPDGLRIWMIQVLDPS